MIGKSFVSSCWQVNEQEVKETAFVSKSESLFKPIVGGEPALQASTVVFPSEEVILREVGGGGKGVGDGGVIQG